MFQSPIINPNSQDSGGLGALNQMQQPAPSLLNQQVPGVQQAPMQQPVQQQKSFYKSGFNPSPALDSLGNPVIQLPSPELPFYETGFGRVFPGGIGGGISQPGFSGNPNVSPITTTPTPRGVSPFANLTPEQIAGLRPPGQGTTGGPFPGSPTPTPAGGFYDPRPGMIDEARRNGTIFAGDKNFTPAPAPAPTPQNRPNPFLGGLSSLLKRKFRR